jgi:predicted unusual protein kinase regulating ubiquinone biosynthesis (AarF/ABC1/UbiB family)
MNSPRLLSALILLVFINHLGCILPSQGFLIPQTSNRNCFLPVIHSNVHPLKHVSFRNQNWKLDDTKLGTFFGKVSSLTGKSKKGPPPAINEIVVSKGWRQNTKSNLVTSSEAVALSPIQHIKEILYSFYRQALLSTVLLWNSLKTLHLQKLYRMVAKMNPMKMILLGSTVVISIYLTLDMIYTKKRQRIDATSEWGRYADHPSIRGRALFGLIGRISLLLLCARVVNTIFPGGEYSLFQKKKRLNNNQNNNNKEIPKSWAARKAGEIRSHAGNKFSEGLLRLGPLYIKIGQILSCRENLLPVEWKESMERLQDRVPAKSGKDALVLAYSAYEGGEKEFHSLFDDFNDVPLAAASLGQVHVARLRSNNAVVAIKLQRPRLRDIYDKDLALMNKIAKAVDKFGGKVGEVGGVKQSWEGIFRDAEEILYREIDYRDEAENAIRFASDFGIGMGGKPVPCSAKSLDGKALPSAASWVRTPYVYDEFSNERALVMEYVPSIKISDNKRLLKEGITTAEKEYLAECLGRAYLRQFCCGKFFSTDPHAGNLGVLVERDENGDKKSLQLVFYDFGQACSLKDDQAAGILEVIEGIIDYDAEKCVKAFTKMGVLADNADLEKVRRKVNDNFQTGKIKVKERKERKKSRERNTDIYIYDDNRIVVQDKADIEENSISVTSSTTPTTSASLDKTTDNTKEDLNDAEIMSYFTLPAEYAFVARAISQMDGVGKSLDSEFDFISAAAPWLVEIKGGEKYLEDEAKKLVNNWIKSATGFQLAIFKKAGFDPTKYKSKLLG